MPKRASIAPDNIFYRARIEAIAHNPLLSNRERAAELARIPRTRMLLLETGRTTPHFDEIETLAELYKAPGLQRKFCKSDCPFRDPSANQRHDPAHGTMAAMELVSLMRTFEATVIDLNTILMDGIVEDHEKDHMLMIMDYFARVSGSYERLCAWAETNRPDLLDRSA